MDRFYTIYRITGPNGRCYIGLTKFTASAGLRAWWATLKADPERYAEYLATRTASLKRTLKNGS